MRVKALPSATYLHLRLAYDPVTGQLTWRHFPSMGKRWNNTYAGKTAGSVKKNGRVVVYVDRVPFYAHRLILKMATGADPAERVDHQDGRTSNNSIVNLRDATPSQNSANMIMPSRGGDLPRGVERVSTNSFRFSIVSRGKKYRQAGFKTPEEAHAAYLAKAAEMHGKYALHLSRG